MAKKHDASVEIMQKYAHADTYTIVRKQISLRAQVELAEAEIVESERLLLLAKSIKETNEALIEALTAVIDKRD